MDYAIKTRVKEQQISTELCNFTEIRVNRTKQTCTDRGTGHRRKQGENTQHQENRGKRPQKREQVDKTWRGGFFLAVCWGLQGEEPAGERQVQLKVEQRPGERAGDRGTWGGVPCD